MKIGAFSSLFNMTPETVRFYVNEGLLIPRCRNSRYDFGEEDKRDMEFLLRLKSYRFSIYQIHRILALRRLSNFDSANDLADYLQLLGGQKMILSQEKNNLSRAIEEIEQEITVLSQKGTSVPTVHQGVPLSFLPLLACPHCQKELKLENCSIERQQILSGELSCTCGYHAVIRNGILVGERGPVSPYDGIDAERNCYRMMSPELLSLVQKAYMQMDEHLSSWDMTGKVVLEDGINNYCFCYTNLINLNPETCYIIADKFEEVVMMYKNLIEKLGIRRNILYIAAGSSFLPLRHGCVDCYIDFDSSNECAILEQRYAADAIKKYLSPQAKYLGAFFHFSMNGESVRELHRQYPEAWEYSFDSGYFLQRLKESWEHVEYEEQFGCVTDSGYGESFTYHVGKEPLWLSLYFCSKMKREAGKNE